MNYPVLSFKHSLSRMYKHTENHTTTYPLRPHTVTFTPIWSVMCFLACRAAACVLTIKGLRIAWLYWSKFNSNLCLSDLNEDMRVIC